jgi:hypothetical protein
MEPRRRDRGEIERCTPAAMPGQHSGRFMIAGTGDRRRLLVVLGTLLVAGVVEASSVASIMPLLAVLADSDAVERVDVSRLAAWFLAPAGI